MSEMLPSESTLVGLCKEVGEAARQMLLHATGDQATGKPVNVPSSLPEACIHEAARLAIARMNLRRSILDATEPSAN